MAKPPVERQREHQANERTFLAWLRTSIALIGFGFAIARFGLFLRELQTAVTPGSTPDRTWLGSQTLGIGLVVVGIVFIALSVWRYNRVYRQIESGYYRASRLMVWVTAAIVTILGILTIPFVLWQPPPATPSRPKNETFRLRERLEQQIAWTKRRF